MDTVNSIIEIRATKTMLKLFDLRILHLPVLQICELKIGFYFKKRVVSFLNLCNYTICDCYHYGSH